MCVAMGALAIAKLSPILRRDEVSGLCTSYMSFQGTGSNNRRRRREANKVMMSEDKRDQLQVGQYPGFHYGSPLAVRGGSF
jgi:hypothetical protein